MNEEKLISVIIPIYNSEKYLRECLDSVVNQSYQNLEIILINDGSTDNSGELCVEFARQDSRVKVIHKQNMGVSAARNDGIDAASGDYIAFVDSDDIILEQMMESLHDLIAHYDADIAVCEYEKISSQSDLHSAEKEPKTGVFGRKDALCNFISTRGYQGMLWNKLFRAELFRKPNFLRMDTDIHVCEDLLMTCLLTERADVIAFTDAKLYGYVIRENSATQTITEKTLSSLTAKKQVVEICNRCGVADAESWYVFSLAHMLTHRNSVAVKKHFSKILTEFKVNRNSFVPRLHSKKEKLLFFTLAVAPRTFSGIYGTLRSIRKHLWKKKC